MQIVKLIDAVIRNFQIIGEAASRVSLNMQNQYQQIPWKLLRGYRNRLVHEYFGVDYKIVWDIINEDLSTLIAQLRDILKS